jgi:hypothetical protein
MIGEPDPGIQLAQELIHWNTKRTEPYIIANGSRPYRLPKKNGVPLLRINSIVALPPAVI